MSRYYLSFLLLLLNIPSINYAESNLLNKPTTEFPAKTTQTLLNINNWTGWIYWDGRSGNNPVGNSGVIYPRGTAGLRNINQLQGVPPLRTNGGPSWSSIN